MSIFSKFFRPGNEPGMFGQSINGPKDQTNSECCDNAGDSLMTCADLLNCQVIQDLLAAVHPPVTLAAPATLGGMSIGPTQILSMTQASAISNGWLSSIDWNTFNSKMNSFDIFDGTTTETISNLQVITFADSFPILAVVSAPRTVTFSLDATGAVPGDVLTYVGPGFAWSAVSGGVTGSGTVDYVPRWTPSGTQLGDSIIQSSATRASIGTAPVATAMLSILNTGLARGLEVQSATTAAAARFLATGTSTSVVQIFQSATVGSAVGAQVFNTSAVAGGTNIGYYSTVSGANVGGINIGGDFHATGATTNYGVRSEGHIVPFTTKTFSLGAAALRFTGLFLGCDIDFDNNLKFKFVGAQKMVLTTTGRIGINVPVPTEILQVGGNIAPDASNLRDLGTSALPWANLYMGTNGKANFDINYIKKSSSANGLELNIASGVAIWTFGWNDGQLRATGNLGGNSISLESSSANNYINYNNSSGSLSWAAGKFADNYAIKGFLAADGFYTEILTILQTNGNVGIKNTAPSDAFDVTGSINVSSVFKVASTQVVSTRKTGYTAMTGTADRAGAYDTSTITLQQLAERMKALLDDLTSHGLIGA